MLMKINFKVLLMLILIKYHLEQKGLKTGHYKYFPVKHHRSFNSFGFVYKIKVSY